MKWLSVILVLAVAGCTSEKAAEVENTGTQEIAVQGEDTDVITNSIGMKFRLIPAGTFMMGSDDDDAAPDEKPAHQVTLTTPFLLGIYEVTQEQYEKVMGGNPSEFNGPQNPVENVSWDDVVAFCKKLSELPAEKAAGRLYRLPTEAEWEYACRAGTTTKYSFGDDETQLSEHAWFLDNSEFKSHPVGEKKPNAWGLYDMHGNVWEWCQDCYGEYPNDAVTDPVGPSEGSGRVCRGGSWVLPAGVCWSSFRGWRDPANRYDGDGFRVAIVLSSPPSE